MVENTSEKRVFYYPKRRGCPSERMCAAGQRRAAAEGWNLLVPGGEIGKIETYARALRGTIALAKGCSTSKRNLISFMVAQAHLNGTLKEYVDENGNFSLGTRAGIFPRNIFEDIERNKKLF
jgi:hypothetical protein